MYQIRSSGQIDFNRLLISTITMQMQPCISDTVGSERMDVTARVIRKSPFSHTVTTSEGHGSLFGRLIPTLELRYGRQHEYNVFRLPFDLQRRAVVDSSTKWYSSELGFLPSPRQHLLSSSLFRTFKAF